MTTEQQFHNLQTRIDVQFELINKRLDVRFDEVHRILLQLQSDLHTFYRELGYQDARLDKLEKES